MIGAVDLPLQFPEHLLEPDSVLDVLLHQILLVVSLVEAGVVTLGVV